MYSMVLYPQEKKPIVAPYSGADVSNCSAISQRQFSKPAPKLNKLANHSMLTKHLHNGEGRIGRSDIHFQASEGGTNHFWHYHSNRLSEHHRFGFNTSHTPASHSKTVNHRSVGVCTNELSGYNIPLLSNTTLPKYSKFTWWTVSGSRNNLEIFKRISHPFCETDIARCSFPFTLLIFHSSVRNAE